MSQFSDQPSDRLSVKKNSQPLWQKLATWARPVLLASVGLHGLFLLIPTAPSDSGEAGNLPELEGETVALIRIPQPREEQAEDDPNGAPPIITQAPPRGSAPAAQPAAPAPAPAAAGSQSAGGINPGGLVAQTPSSQELAASETAIASNTSNSTGNSSSTPSTDFPSKPSANSAPAGKTRGGPVAQTPSIEAEQGFLEALRDRILALRTVYDTYTFDPQGTTAAAATQALATWTKTLSDTAGVPKPLETNLNLSYPLRRCLPTPPGSALVGVVVDAKGKPMETQLLKSTGYAPFNEQAIAEVQQYKKFPKASVPKAHVVEMDVAYRDATCLKPVS